MNNLTQPELGMNKRKKILFFNILNLITPKELTIIQRYIKYINQILKRGNNQTSYESKALLKTYKFFNLNPRHNTLEAEIRDFHFPVST